MDFAMSTRQQEWHDAAVRFAQAELVDDLLGRDERREFWREGWRRCAEFGIQGLPVPTEYGGEGEDLPATIAALEGLGYGCPDNGLVFALNASLWTVSIPLLRFGTEAQRRRYLPGLCDGTLVGANAASEPGRRIPKLPLASVKRQVRPAEVGPGTVTSVTPADG